MRNTPSHPDFRFDDAILALDLGDESPLDNLLELPLDDRDFGDLVSASLEAA